MSQYTSENGVWNGWSWRFVGISVLVVLAAQLLVYYTVHYPLVQSLPLAVLVISYIIIPRVKQRRLGNAIVGVLATYVLSVFAEMALEGYYITALRQHQVSILLQDTLLPLLLGLVMAYLYLRLTEWSERKRTQLEARRQQQNRAQDKPPQRRVHRKKKRKKR